MPHTGDQLAQKKTSVSNLQGAQNKITRAQPESNRRPQDLQSHALPLSYAPVMCEIAHLFFAICWLRLKKMRKVLPGLEPGSKDSKSLVMTITL